MGMRITTDVVITEIYEHRTEDGKISGHVSFREVEPANGIEAISGKLPASAFATPGLVHIGQVWRVQFDYQPDFQFRVGDVCDVTVMRPADEEEN